MKVLLLILCCYCLVNLTIGKESKSVCNNKRKGQNLELVYLTTKIKANDITSALHKSCVEPLKQSVSSNAGFFTVNELYNSNLFCWYFRAEENPENAPIVIWLQGGPGTSSIWGLLHENGPFYIKEKRGMKMRNDYWSQVVHMVYLDTVVGAGYSFTEDPAGYPRDQAAVAKDLLNAITQFFKLFPKLKNNDLFIAGQGFGGKYALSLANAIDVNNKRPSNKINLKGLIIANGIIDPEPLISYGLHLHTLGLIDSTGRKIFEAKETELLTMLRERKFAQAFNTYREMLFGTSKNQSLLYHLSGYEDNANYLHNRPYFPYGDMEDYLKKVVFRMSVHVGNLTFNDGTKPREFLINDIMKSAKPMFERILQRYPILIYTGQLDLQVPFPSMYKFVESLKWDGLAKYKTLHRKQWKIDSDLLAYCKSLDHLTEVLVLGAGHNVAFDQPFLSKEMIRKFTYNDFPECISATR